MALKSVKGSGIGRKSSANDSGTQNEIRRYEHVKGWISK